MNFLHSGAVIGTERIESVSPPHSSLRAVGKRSTPAAVDAILADAGAFPAATHTQSIRASRRAARSR